MTRLCFVLTLIFGAALYAETRVWTDTAGRKVEAELIRVDGDQVRIRRSIDGQVFSLPIVKLSEADQEFLRAQTKTTAEASADPEQPGKAKALVWPRRTDLPDNYDVEIVREDNSAGVYIYRTPNFEFHSDVKLARKVVREFGKIFEGTYASMKAFPLAWNPQPTNSHYKTRLFRERSDYQAAGGMPNSGGVYIPWQREILVPLSSLGVEKSSSGFTLDDSGEHSTLVHEITHQVHHDWLAKLPPWMTEGMAVYMESVPNDDGEFRFDRRDLEEYVRRENGAGPVTMAPLEKLMTMNQSAWNANFTNNPKELHKYYQSAFLLVNYFLHLDGEGEGRRINAYCRAIESGTPDEQARALLLAGRSYTELTEDLQRAYKREGVEVSD